MYEVGTQTFFILICRSPGRNSVSSTSGEDMITGEMKDSPHSGAKSDGLSEAGNSCILGLF